MRYIEIELGIHERAVIGPAIVELVEITQVEEGRKARIGFEAPRDVRIERQRKPFKRKSKRRKGKKK